MNCWKNCTLADLGEIVGGSTPSTKKAGYYGGNIAWITPKDLANLRGRYIQKGERNITEEGLNSCSARVLPRHSVLFSSRAPIGYVAITENEVSTNQGFKSIIPNKGTDFLFLFYLLVYNRDRIENMGSGTTFKEVSGSVMKNILVSVPIDIKEQKAIAHILGSLDDKIENNVRINHHLEQMADAIFKSWFVDLKPFGGVKPSDWYCKKLGDICQCILGGTPNRNKVEYWNGNIPWINSSETNRFRITTPSEYITEQGLQHSSTKILPAKTVVFAITGTTLGQVSVLEFDSCANQSVVGIIPNDVLPYEFIYPFVKNNVQCIISNKTGGAQQHVNKKNIESVPLVLPTNQEIRKYHHQVAPIYAAIASNCFENERLIKLRDLLLPRLMSGELSVADLGDGK